MPLAMARPMKRPGIQNKQFVQRIPADVKDKVRGMTLALPLGSETVTMKVSQTLPDIRLSLRTADPVEAKARQAAIAAHLDGVWRSVRDGPKPLSNRQIAALSGVVYKDWIEAMSEEPGPPGVHLKVIRLNQKAKEAGTEEQWMGAHVDALLAREGIVTDTASRQRLIRASLDASTQASEVLHRNANLDYRADPEAARFPEWVPSAAPVQPKPSPSRGQTSVMSLFEKLAAERRYAPKTVSEWTRSLNSLTDHAGTTDAAAITPRHIIAWMDDLVSKGLSAKTINETYLAAVKALFKWAKGKLYLPSNPALETPKVERRDEGEGKRGFELPEALVVLRAALKEQSPARRWVPWLLAYSGARVGEIMQLRPQDIRQEPESGLWFIDITSAAGRLKNKSSARVVPLHPHLIEMGFLAWVQTQKAPRLFYEERPGEATDGKRSRKTVALNRLADWVRGLGIEGVKSGEVSPNHGWRHRFSTELVNLDVPDATRKRLTGHSLTGEDKRYVGKIVIEKLYEAVSRLPPYAC